MRLWSVHPKYLDAKGLVALWREGLLAKNVLEGNTKGYKHHPQLLRFKNTKNPVDAINTYLKHVHDEASDRGYNFDRDKINWETSSIDISVTDGQMEYERKHLLNKLKVRDPDRFDSVSKLTNLDVHPMFNIKPGTVEDWEIV